jgi:hypothetical protein
MGFEDGGENMHPEEIMGGGSNGIVVRVILHSISAGCSDHNLGLVPPGRLDADVDGSAMDRNA